MKVEFDKNGEKLQGEVVATIGDFYEALFIVSLADNTFVKIPIEMCKKVTV